MTLNKFTLGVVSLAFIQSIKGVHKGIVFLNDVKNIISCTESALKSKAMESCERQADALPNDVRMIRSANLQAAIFNECPEKFSEQVGEFVEACEETGSWPSLTALSYMAMEEFGIPFESTEAKAILTAATLGEIPNNLPYHNNSHYRKVMMATIRQIHAHNQIYADTSLELSARDISLLLTSASIHDLGHDGLGNGDVASRLEKQSFDKVKPFLVAAGVDDEFLYNLKNTLIGTDINPMGSVHAPCNIIKSMYKENFDQGRVTKLSDEFEGQESKKFSLISTLFEEADLMPSYVFGYKQGLREHMRVAEELGFSGSPTAMRDFLKKVLGGCITEAGKTNQMAYERVCENFSNDCESGMAYLEQPHIYPLTPKMR